MTATLMVEVAGYEIWRHGQILVVVPIIREEWPPKLREAVARRRSLLLEGRCACGASLPSAGYMTGLAWLYAEHERGCPAPDALRLAERWEASR